MIKIVFFDIDGTFLNKQSKIEPSTEKALEAAKEKGILCGLATGRGPADIQHLVTKYNLDFAACYNGQYIYKNNGEVISAKPIDKKNIRELAKFADKESRELAFGLSDRMVGSRLLRAGNSELVRFISPILPKQLSSGLKTGFQQVVRRYRKAHYSHYPQLREPVYQVVMVSPETEQPELEMRFPNVTITRSNPYSIDILPKGASKFGAIKRVCAYYGYNEKEAMAFGDSWNDIEMIEGVGFGVAMGNAVEPLKQVADFVTTSNDKDGIARAFQQFRILDTEVANEVISELSMEDMNVEDAFGNVVSLLPDGVQDFLEKKFEGKVGSSKDDKFNKVKEFHQTLDKTVKDAPEAFKADEATHRAAFKIEEIVEFLYASCDNDRDAFEQLIEKAKTDIDKAKNKVLSKNTKVEDVLTEEVDALIDLLYFTYGSFVLMGVDPEEIFQIVHEANMAKVTPDGETLYDEETGKILKPAGWEEKYAPEEKIKTVLEKQMNEKEKE